MQWTDVWLLLSILLGGGQDPSGATLDSIISTGDSINHAIFRYEEVASGLTRLSRNGYIYEKSKKFFATSKASKLFEEAKSKDSSIYKNWDYIGSAMGASRYSGDLPNPNNNLSYPGITPEAVSIAAQKWHEEAMKWIRESLEKTR